MCQVMLPTSKHEGIINAQIQLFNVKAESTSLEVQIDAWHFIIATQDSEFHFLLDTLPSFTVLGCH
jgi:hypothetical protein